MKIAYLPSTGRGRLDDRITDIVFALRDDGRRVAGLVQINTEREKRDHCDMDLQVIPDGPLIRITQDLGAAARGCRLDADALERAVTEVGARLNPKIELLVINKFGKQEAEGRGFRDVIAEALAMGIPVLVGVNDLNLEPFTAFSGGLAERLNTTADVMAWLCG